jgi:hypothetical protein
VVSRELAKVRDNGLPEEEFDALMAQKNLELQKLFATYARTDTDILISQRMRSLQNQVVDIAPEQYQKLRQEFLNSLTVDMLNQYLRQQLSQDMALVLQQPKGEPEYNMKDLQATWERLMAPAPAAATSGGAAEARNDASDIPQGSKSFTARKCLRAVAWRLPGLLRHRVARDNRPAILNHRAGRQVSASGGGFRIAAGQAHRQIAGAERIARRGGIHHSLCQLHGRYFQQRLPGDRHQA